MRLLIGGSPCTYWSIAQKNNRETEASGIGWELFKNYLIAKEKFKPDYFLYENNKSAAEPIKQQIRKELGVWDGSLFSPQSDVRFQYINSALVSAQNRQRFYVHNFGDVPQPQDRGILLKDILESGIGWQEKGYALTASYNGAVAWNTIERSQRTMVAEPIDYKPYGKLKTSANGIYCVSEKDDSTAMGYTVSFINGKSPTVISGQASRMKIIEPIRIGDIGSNSQAHRVYSPFGKSITINAGGGGQGGKTGLYACPIGTTKESKAFALTAYYSTGQNPEHTLKKSLGTMVAETWDGKTYPVYEVLNGLITIKDKQYPIKLPDGYYIIRKLTVTECERLQTLPDGYTSKAGVSNSQCYKAIGNGWTAEVIIHLLSYGLKDVPRDMHLEVLSMYDGIATGRYCLDKLGFKNITYKSYEIDKYAIKIANYNYPDIIQCGDAFKVRNDWEY